MKFKKLTQTSRKGKIIFGSNIIENIVRISLSELDNIELSSPKKMSWIKRTPIKVSYDKNNVTVDVAVDIHYLQNVPDYAFKIQESIRYNIESMTDYRVEMVNVYVNDVSFDDKTQSAPVDDKIAEQNVDSVEAKKEDGDNDSENDAKNAQ
mgnify:CR=1 FL=1